MRLVFLSILPELKNIKREKCKHAICGNNARGGRNQMGPCREGNLQLLFAIQVLLTKYVDEDKGKDNAAICEFLGLPVNGCVKTLKGKRSAKSKL
jgi:hypothetical protein